MLLTGDDQVGRDAARDAIVKDLQNKHPGLSIESFDADHTTMLEFVERISSPSLFADKRLFVVRHCGDLPDRDIQQLNGVLTFAFDDVWVVLELEAKPQKKSKAAAPKKKESKSLPAAFAEKTKKDPGRFSVMEFVSPKEYEVPKWLVANTQILMGRTILLQDAQHLVNSIGADCAMCISELRKIDLLLPPGAAISRGSIDQFVGAFRLPTQYDLVQFIADKKQIQTLECIEAVFAQAVNVTPYIFAMFKHFWALLRIRGYAVSNAAKLKLIRSKNFSDRTAQSEAALELGVAAGLLAPHEKYRVYPVIIASNIIAQAQGFSEPELLAILDALFEFERGVKTGAIEPDKKAFQMLSYRIISGNFSDMAA